MSDSTSPHNRDSQELAILTTILLYLILVEWLIIVALNINFIKKYSHTHKWVIDYILLGEGAVTFIFFIVWCFYLWDDISG
jgi:hypothetical protein